MSMWNTWKQGFTAWEQATAAYTEKVMATPAVLNPMGAMLTAVMKTKTATDKAMATWWSMWGLPTRGDQLQSLHKLNQLESRLMDLEEKLGPPTGVLASLRASTPVGMEK